jgi:hypothetical protein
VRRSRIPGAGIEVKDEAELAQAVTRRLQEKAKKRADVGSTLVLLFDLV